MPPHSRMSAGFRDDLEGLRGLAVLLVILFHAECPAFRGGYVGIDVFFVLSGYFISGLLLQEWRATGAIRLVDFFLRRARRLLPSATVVLISGLAISSVCLYGSVLREAARDAASAAFFVSNFRFILRTTDYLATRATASPFLHFWSLSVEEQYYFAWPLFLLLFAKIRPGRSFLIRPSIWIIALSLPLGAWLTRVNQPVAYFLPVTRAWEFALGALLYDARWPARLAAYRKPAGAVGLLAVLAAAYAYGEKTAHPGLTALLPAAGTAVLIACAATPANLLSRPPLRFLGRVSYPMYLWHWPILIWAAALLGSPLSVYARVLSIGSALALAVATHVWIEAPFRRQKPARSPSLGLSTLALTSLASISVAVCLSLLVSRHRTQWPASLPPEAQVEADLPELYAKHCHAGFRESHPEACVFGAKNASRSAALLGDSHAAHWFPALEALAEKQGLRLYAFTKSRCSFVETSLWHPFYKRAYTECDAFRARVIEDLTRIRPEVVWISNARGLDLLDAQGRIIEKGPAQRAAWRNGLAKMLDELRPLSARIVVIGDTPWPGFHALACLEKYGDESRCHYDLAQATDPQWLAMEREVTLQHGARYLDPTPWICADKSCALTHDRSVIFLDESHLSASFARSLAGRLEEAGY